MATKKKRGLAKPRLTIQQVLRWADAYHLRTGRWPTRNGGIVHEAPDESWSVISNALRKGCRGFAGGSSLAKLLAKHRGIRHPLALPRLSVPLILKWADAHHRRTGKWPTELAGRVLEAPEDSWNVIHRALWYGKRGLPGGTTLSRLLAKHRGTRSYQKGNRLTYKRILAWADAHHRRTGRWPQMGSGPIYRVPGQGWRAVDASLREGYRGLPGGESLAKLLARRRGVRHHLNQPRMTVKQILAWADAHHKKYGEYPKAHAGPKTVPGTSGERWAVVDDTLRRGWRGLPGGSSLAMLLLEERGVSYKLAQPRLHMDTIREWAIQHYTETGEWPTLFSGPVRGTLYEKWWGINNALRVGRRGLPGGSSLAKLLAPLRRKPQRRGRAATR